MVVRRLVPLLLLPLAVGCVATQGDLALQQEIRSLREEVRVLKGDVAKLSRLGEIDAARKIETLARQQAELQAGIDTIKVEAQSLRGRVDDQLKQGRLQADEVNLNVDDISLRTSRMEERIQKMESSVETLRMQRPGTAGSPAVGAVVPAAVPGAPKVSAQAPDILYQQGLDRIRGGDYTGGREAMERFVKEYPDHDLVVNAIYWSGEALYGEGTFEAAIVRFQEVIQKYGGHPKVPAALLKQGLAFNALKDRKNASTLLKKVIADFPESPEAKKAEERLKDWK